MFADEIRSALRRCERSRLAEMAAVVWKAFGSGVLGEDDAQALADEIEALKKAKSEPRAPRRVGSRPRSSASLERRRRWVASGLMPPQIAAGFTMGEGAALAVIAAECAKRGRCTLTLGHIAGVAGVCKSTVRNAVRRAESLGLVKNEEWRLSAFRNAPNTVTILSAEWSAWLRLVVRHRGGSKTVERTPTGSRSSPSQRPSGHRFRSFGGMNGDRGSRRAECS